MLSPYIALEGIDGAGKTTVATALKDWLMDLGKAVVLVAEPGGTKLGNRLRAQLLSPDWERSVPATAPLAVAENVINFPGSQVPPITPWAEACLFAAQRAQLVVEVIRPVRKKGVWVISDRSFYSSIAYQGFGRGLGMEEVRAINRLAVGDTCPDLVILLDTEYETAAARDHDQDRISAEGASFMTSVAAGYRQLAAIDPVVAIIPASLEIDDVITHTIEIVRSRWPEELI